MNIKMPRKLTTRLLNLIPSITAPMHDMCHIFVANANTLGLGFTVPITGNSTYTVRIERFKLIGNIKALQLFDDIINASKEGGRAAEVMLELLNGSLENSNE